MNTSEVVRGMVGLINYQEGAVVSRALIDKSAGTVTIFAFDQDQGLSEHTAPYNAMVQVLDGEIEIKINREPHMVKTGEMIIMPANSPHALHAAKPCKMLLIMIKE